MAERSDSNSHREIYRERSPYRNERQTSRDTRDSRERDNNYSYSSRDKERERHNTNSYSKRDTNLNQHSRERDGYQSDTPKRDSTPNTSPIKLDTNRSSIYRTLAIEQQEDLNTITLILENEGCDDECAVLKSRFEVEMAQWEVTKWDNQIDALTL